MAGKIKDFLELLKHDRKTQIFTFVGLILIIGFIMTSPEPRKKVKKYARPAKVSTGGVGASEAYKDIIQAFSKDVQVLQEQVKDLQKSVEERDKRFEEYDAKTSKVFTQILERINAAEDLARQSIARAREGAVGTGESVSFVPPSEELEPFGLVEEEPVPPKVVERPKAAVISVGDTARVQLIAGVNAPTDGTPYPVIFKLIDDVVGPDNSRLPLGEARIIAAAQGSLSDARALFRLTDLSIRLPDGQRRTYKIDGWIVGEDGLRGMRGRLVDNLDKTIAAATMVGGAEGLADAVARSERTTFVSDRGSLTSLNTGSMGRLAGASAVSGALRAWNDIIGDRVRELVPFVEVLAGREANAVFAKSVVIDGLFEAMKKTDTGLASLD